jgi:hypothetical protein
MFGVDAAADPRGEASKAYFFDSGGDIISLANSAELNFTDKITISFWVRLTSLDEESFIISHGSWDTLLRRFALHQRFDLAARLDGGDVRLE